MLISKYKDNFYNLATIETLNNFKAYYNDKNSATAYKLTLISKYNNGIIYFVSIYESMKEAETKLQEFSCGTFKKISK